MCPTPIKALQTSVEQNPLRPEPAFQLHFSEVLQDCLYDLQLKILTVSE